MARWIGPLLVLCVVLSACRDDAEALMNRRVRVMVAGTTPAGGSIFEAPQSVRGRMGWQVRWRLQSPTPCSEYRSWIQEQLGASYRLSTDSERRLVGSKHIEGDLFQLSFELFSAKTACHVSVEFEGMPD